MNDIQIFQNEQFGAIRTAGTADSPLFCLADICRVLDLQTGATKNRLNQGGISLINTPTTSGNQMMTFINEQNLYKVIMRSDKPQAEPFQDWVCGEVLPSIRKTGSYTAKQMTRKDLAKMIIQQEEEMEVLRIENKRQAEVMEAQKPKVVFADAVVGSRSTCLIGELAKIITQNGYKIGQNRLFAWMREHHYLGQIGEYYNIPCQKYLEMGLFELKKNVHSQNGNLVTTITPKVTGKGQQYFINLFMGKVLAPLSEGV
jgi:anti-repressor protein